MEINRIYNCDCIEGLKQLESDSVDLTVTSPPYDNLRSYGDTLEWSFETFKPIAKELYRVTKPGGVVVWVVGDACIKESETLSSFRQAMYFVDECGFKLHDTMIYEKNGSSYPVKRTSKRYTQIFEYMFVFVKGKIRNDITLIADKRNKWAGWTSWGRNTKYDTKGNMLEETPNKPISEFSIRNNIWKYSVSFNDKTGHPAVFPEKLAEDHILSWTLKGDLVLDPFMGSGTTAKMAMLNGRNYIGFEKNTDYYEKALERVGKYFGKSKEDRNIETLSDGEGEAYELQVNVDDDKELAGKTTLWNKLIEELNQYFNEQSLGILKSLKLVFKSKSNDERVKKFYGNDEEKIEEVMQMNDEEVVKIVEKYFGWKRLPEYVIELNDEAKKRNLQKELDELNGVKPEKKRIHKESELKQAETTIFEQPIEINVVDNTDTSSNNDSTENNQPETKQIGLITNKRIRGYKVGSVAYFLGKDGIEDICEIKDRRKTEDGNYVYDVKIHISESGIVYCVDKENVSPEQLRHHYKRNVE